MLTGTMFWLRGSFVSLMFGMVVCQAIPASDLGSVYSKLLLEKYGSNDVLSESGLQSLVSQMSCQHAMPYNVSVKECWQGPQNTSNVCLNKVCLGDASILDLFDGDLPSSDVQHFASVALYAAQNEACKDNHTEEGPKHPVKPTTAEVWGYSFLCVTLINLCALMGMMFIPLMKKDYYSKLLMYMVALAVGTLTGSSLLFLIPGAFALGEEGSVHRHDYVWKMTMVVGGIYLFFLVERILQIVLGSKHLHDSKDGSKKEEKYAPAPTRETKRPRTLSGGSMVEDGEEPLSSIKFHTVTRVEESMNMSFKVASVIKEGEQARSPDSTVELLHENDATTPTVSVSNGNAGHDTVPEDSKLKKKQEIKSVAWMIIFGDGLHNFIDGLSIGAAFAGSTLAGVSVSVAVICEELPHELGDFAILLDSGMRMSQALGYNFLSACMCYLGLVVGILVGELEEGSMWIFALAGGMFLYIALCDMLPEVNHAGEEEARTTGNKWRVFLLQNAGLLSGFGIMLLLALFAESIDFES